MARPVERREHRVTIGRQPRRDIDEFMELSADRIGQALAELAAGKQVGIVVSVSRGPRRVVGAMVGETGEIERALRHARKVFNESKKELPDAGQK
jgi:hypothetical protein